MPMTAVGWVPDEMLAGLAGQGLIPQNIFDTFTAGGTNGAPPQHIIDYLAQVGTPWDPAKYSWDSATGNLTDLASGGSWDMRSVPNNSLGSTVVLQPGLTPHAESDFGAGADTELGNRILPGGGTAYSFEPGQGPTFFGSLSGPGDIFFSRDPAAINDFEHRARTERNQAIAQIATLIAGGTAATGGFGGGAAGGTGTATVSGTNTAAGVAAPASGAGALAPITTTASMLPGGVPAVTGAGFGATTAATPFAAMPAFGGAASTLSGAANMPSLIGQGGQDMTALGGGGGGGFFQNLLGGNSNWGSLIGGLLGAIDARNQPDSMTTNQGGTSTSVYGQNLPPEITGPAGEALAALSGLFGSGYNVAGIDHASTAAISGLQGFAGGGGINPYLDSVFNSAADSTRTRLSSEFARAGRNVNASLPARSEELQHLAAGIYGPGYEAERGRQFGSLLPLLGAGDYRRGVEQQQMDAPTTNLMRYLSGLQGLMPFFPGTQTQNTTQTGSVTQPLFNNPWAGFLGGAQLGSLYQRPGG